MVVRVPNENRAGPGASTTENAINGRSLSVQAPEPQGSSNFTSNASPDAPIPLQVTPTTEAPSPNPVLESLVTNIGRC